MSKGPDATDPNFVINGEYYLNERTGRTHIRLPAGGSGGGVTSYADVEATEDQHLAFLNSHAALKEQEAADARQRHTDADIKRSEKTELYFNDETGYVHKRLPGDPPGIRDPRATDEEETAFLEKRAVHTDEPSEHHPAAVQVPNPAFHQ